MSDLTLRYDSKAEAFDLALASDQRSTSGYTSTGFTADAALESAIVISLFCDRQANIDDPLPGGAVHRYGWWADAHARVDGDLIGSRLWLVSREKVQASVLLRAREYAREALQWLIDDGIARSVDVVASVARADVLVLDITIARRETGTFRKLWELQLRPK